MAITEFTLKYRSQPLRSIRNEWGHAGVVSSGDLEALIQKSGGIGEAVFKIRTKASGFEQVWQKVLERFVERTGLGDVIVEINDNAATPAVVIKRIEQAIQNAGGLKA